MPRVPDVVCEGVGAHVPLDDAQTVHRLPAAIGKPCGHLFCTPRCAADGDLSANEYAPAFSALRVKMGNRADAVSVGIALGVKTLKHDGNYVKTCAPPWLEAVWQYRPRGWLAFCARLRDVPDVRDQVDAAFRLGGTAASYPLLKDFEEAAR